MKPNQQHIKVYLCLEDNIVLEGLSKHLSEANTHYTLIGIDSINEFIAATKSDQIYTQWILDYNSCLRVRAGFEESELYDDKDIFVLLNEKEFLNIKGQEFPGNIYLLPFYLKGEAFIDFIGTEMQRAIKRHNNRSGQRLFKELFRKSQQAKLLVDLNTKRIVDLNDSASRHFKKTYAELINQDFTELHNGNTESILNTIDKAVNGLTSYVKVRVNDENGEFQDYEYSFNRINADRNDFLSVEIFESASREISDELYNQQNEMLKSTLESIDDLFFTLDRSGNFMQYFQPDESTHFTLSSDVFLGKNISEVGYPEEVAKLYMETIKRVLTEDKAEQIDYYIEAFGSRLWYNARISPRRSVFGIPEGVTVLCRDVTRQKRSEETIKRARDFYLTLLTDFPSMIWKTNTSKKADYFNKTWLDFTGNDLETELQIDWVEKLHKNDVSLFLSTILKAYKNKEEFQFEHRLKHKSGNYRWVYNVGRPFYNLEGHFAGFIGSCYDITERRDAEDMLILQKSAMESALEGILIIDANKENCPVIYSNSELSKITGISKENVLGMDFLNVLGKPVNDSITREIVNSLRIKSSFKGEIQCIDQEGNESWRLLYMSPVKDKKNGVTNFVAVLNDITESKESENALIEKNKELRKTNEELDRFVYSTSHELRSPLMSVLGLINLIETDRQLVPGATENTEDVVYLSMIKDTISRLDKIIHDIIDYSRNSRLDIIYENIDFENFIEKSINNHKYIQGTERINFIIDINNKVPFFSDKKRIEIIFNNFISNCLRYHNLDQDNPFVEIKVKTSPVNAVITISDNGTGISEKHLPKIYNMFYRATEKSTGSGIGLYIVKEIIDKLKGNIQIHSTLNKGTKFIIELPNYVMKDQRLLSVGSIDYNSL